MTATSLEEQFGSGPFWRLHAEWLARSAFACAALRSRFKPVGEPGSGVGPVPEALLAMALENLLKGQLVDMGVQPPTDHFLISMWQSVGLTLRDADGPWVRPVRNGSPVKDSELADDSKLQEALHGDVRDLCIATNLIRWQRQYPRNLSGGWTPREFGPATFDRIRGLCEQARPDWLEGIPEDVERVLAGSPRERP